MPIFNGYVIIYSVIPWCWTWDTFRLLFSCKIRDIINMFVTASIFLLWNCFLRKSFQEWSDGGMFTNAAFQRGLQNGPVMNEVFLSFQLGPCDPLFILWNFAKLGRFKMICGRCFRLHWDLTEWNSPAPHFFLFWKTLCIGLYKWYIYTLYLAICQGWDR